jgi:hypothetical protein
MRQVLIAALVLLPACRSDAPPPQAAAPEPGSREWKIANARSAAPYVVAAVATVLDWPASDTAAADTLAPGTSGWVCFPDYPGTPANDPVCADEVFAAWFRAWSARQPPRPTAMGVSYMLQGGQSASDTDPFAMSPAPGQAWHEDPPHLMIVMPNPQQSFRGLPAARTAGPWVMFAGTPYAHLMVPAGTAAP